MKVVYKFEIPFLDHITLPLPKDAELLHFASQGGAPMIWALVDPTQPQQDRSFRLAGTGHPIEEEGLTFVGTAMFGGGALVFHLFEIGDQS